MIRPKVFISHASEDKERFVKPFAERLRARGVDAWLDKWEMLPGDSLVQKIEEGIKEAKAFIIVLSCNSVNKPWVRVEIDAAFIKHVNESSRLIPVIIDDCEVPELLKPKIWVRIKNLSSYDSEFEEILHAIFEVREKPAIGAPPKYTEIITTIPDLNEIDTLVLKTACEIAIEQGNEYIETEDVENRLREYEIDGKKFEETLEILNERNYIKASREKGPNFISNFSITLYGFDEYAKTFIKDYYELVERICFKIVNEGKEYPEIGSDEISEEFKIPSMIVVHIFELLENNDLVSLSQELSFNRTIIRVSPELKRKLNK